MEISNNLNKLLKELPTDVKLIAVSKTKPNQDILEAYHAGQKVFGENKVQELVSKYEQLSKNIEWHFIGHLQRNKVKYIAGFISLIHAVDSLKLLKAINKEAVKNNRVINCLLQIHIAREETKYGLSIEEAAGLLKSDDYKQLNNIRITGLMGMATFTEDVSLIRDEFKTLVNLHKDLKNNYFSTKGGSLPPGRRGATGGKDKPEFKEISLGMSSDYNIAIEEGSTMVRIGSLIFGERN